LALYAVSKRQLSLRGGSNLLSVTDFTVVMVTTIPDRLHDPDLAEDADAAGVGDAVEICP